MATRKETIEYDAKFLNEWGTFCDSKGYVKRQASHACRLAFMALTPKEREEIMEQATQRIAKTERRR